MCLMGLHGAPQKRRTLPFSLWRIPAAPGSPTLRGHLWPRLVNWSSGACRECRVGTKDLSTVFGENAFENLENACVTAYVSYYTYIYSIYLMKHINLKGEVSSQSPDWKFSHLVDHMSASRKPEKPATGALKQQRLRSSHQSPIFVASIPCFTNITCSSSAEMS